jgi:hypothetical protein
LAFAAEEAEEDTEEVDGLRGLDAIAEEGEAVTVLVMFCTRDAEELETRDEADEEETGLLEDTAVPDAVAAVLLDEDTPPATLDAPDFKAEGAAAARPAVALLLPTAPPLPLLLSTNLPPFPFALTVAASYPSLLPTLHVISKKAFNHWQNSRLSWYFPLINLSTSTYF